MEEQMYSKTATYTLPVSPNKELQTQKQKKIC